MNTPLTSPKRIKFFHVDAFTSEIFSGNPAAVCLLEEWLPSETMLNISAENNLSETAFVIVQSDALCQIRWFTPLIEVDLCGHATLAAAFVVLEFLRPELTLLKFTSKGGDLQVRREGPRLFLNFPALSTSVWPEVQESLLEALGTDQKGIVFKSLYDALVVFEKEDSIRNLAPLFEKLKKIDVRGVIATSAGKEVDFVSRFFAPGAGIDEDPVTGSAHSVLTPFWSQRLGKCKLIAKQISKREGNLYCEDLGNGRVEIGGEAVLFSQGEILLKQTKD